MSDRFVWSLRARGAASSAIVADRPRISPCASPRSAIRISAVASASGSAVTRPHVVPKKCASR
jgi:hypothetical protein